jgi:hypothetical protein
MLKLWNVADGTPASPNVQVAGNISRVAYAPWLRAWVWGDGWTNKVEKLPTHLFSPAVHPAERQDLLRRALVISGRDVGRSQTEAPIVNSKRVAMYQEWRPAAIQSRVSGPEAETLASTRGSDSHAGTSSRDN